MGDNDSTCSGEEQDIFFVSFFLRDRIELQLSNE